MLNETYRAMLGNKSVIRETFMYGKKRAAEIGYENVFDYSLGNPSVPCPPEFTAAMQDLLANEEPVNLHGYCPSQGDPGFRADVAAHLAKTFFCSGSGSISSSSSVITSSSSGIFSSFSSLQLSGVA